MKVAELQINQSIRPLKPADSAAGIQKPDSAKTGVSFGTLLERQLGETNGLKFSAHAMKRMESRAVNLNELDLQRLQQGVQELEARGAQNSVILMDDRAFVVSVKNRTVVTAVDQIQNNQKIFTNIDSLAIV
ncbi:TIGR02530 family flagellar biosynthesis protein [Caldithrix abyssi]